MAVTATVLTRLGVTVPFFHVPPSNDIPAGEWVSLDLVKPPLSFARASRSMKTYTAAAPCSTGWSSDECVSRVKLRDVVAWLPESTRPLEFIPKLRETTLVRPQVLSRVLLAHKATKTHWRAAAAGVPLYFRTTAEFAAIPAAPLVHADLDVLVRGLSLADMAGCARVFGDG